MCSLSTKSHEFVQHFFSLVLGLSLSLPYCLSVRLSNCLLSLQGGRVVPARAGAVVLGGHGPQPSAPRAALLPFLARRAARASCLDSGDYAGALALQQQGGEGGGA
jgi:hypothetical protein